MSKPIQDTAHIILFDSDYRILLQHRDANIEIFPDVWGFFGGSVSAGEKPEQALQREVLEELNYSILSPELFHIQAFEIEAYQGKRYFYLEKYNQRPVELREGQGFGWYWISEMKNLKMIEMDRVVLDLLKKKPEFNQ